FAQRFEQAWIDGAHLPFEAFLPDDAALRPAVLLELVEADLILRLENGESARVEHYLERFPDLAEIPGALLDLLGTEYRQRWRRGHGIRPAEYVQRFPQFQEQLWAQLQSLDQHLGREEDSGQADSPPAAEPIPVPHSPAAQERVGEIVHDLGNARQR